LENHKITGARELQNQLLPRVVDAFHDDFTDAEHTINFVREGKANGKLYNIYAETIDVHISPTLGITCEVLSLIYSFVTS
jgi:hypothetical protein